jgi:hypothetical protein
VRPCHPSPLRLSRRAFLRGAGLAASLAAVGRIRALPAAAAELAALGPRFFSDHETEILTQIVERMVDTGDPAAPAVRDTRAVATIDGLVAGLDPAVSGQLPLALRLFEWGPLVFDFTFSRYTRMTPAEQDASLEAWMTSRLQIRRLAFAGLRNLALLGYWSQDETWPLIGYAGPLLGARDGAGGASPW